MTTFDKVKAVLMKAFGGEKKADIQKPTIATAITNTMDLCDDVAGIYKRPLLERVTKAIKERQFTAPNDRKVLEIHALYKARLDSKRQTSENTAFMGAVADALPKISADLHLLEKNFTKVFGDLKSPDDMKVTHGFALGYLHLAKMTADFISSMVYLINIDKVERPPAYLEVSARDDAVAVGDFIMHLALRPTGQTILTEIDKIRRDGADVFLKVGDQTIADYAHPQDYRPMVQQALSSGFVKSPTMIIGDALILIQRWEYEKRKYLREWMTTKVALLTMQLDGVDPNDPEYRRLQKVLSGYTSMIADLDRKIARYEES